MNINDIAARCLHTHAYAPHLRKITLHERQHIITAANAYRDHNASRYTLTTPQTGMMHHLLPTYTYQPLTSNNIDQQVQERGRHQPGYLSVIGWSGAAYQGANDSWPLGTLHALLCRSESGTQRSALWRCTVLFHHQMHNHKIIDSVMMHRVRKTSYCIAL
jgi:hypothetical protein